MKQPTQFSETPLSAQGSYGDKYQVCSSRVLQLSNSAEILLRVASEREEEAASKNTMFYQIVEWSEIVQRRLTIELHVSVTGYGGVHFPFSGITQYLRGLVSVYECPIVAWSEY